MWPRRVLAPDSVKLVNVRRRRQQIHYLTPERMMPSSRGPTLHQTIIDDKDYIQKKRRVWLLFRRNMMASVKNPQIKGAQSTTRYISDHLSTIIRHLTGIFRQDSGTVRLGGEDVWENAALKAKIAAIPDDWYYFNSAGIGDMMRFYKGFYPNFSTERYEKLREVFDLDEKRPIRRFSKGMQKQAAFWLALSAMPDYLILDEPVDGLDPVMRRQVWSLMMGDVAERGTTVLVSSHNLRELEDVCDHVGIMDHGHVLLERSLAQLQDNMVKLQVVFPSTAWRTFRQSCRCFMPRSSAGCIPSSCG